VAGLLAGCSGAGPAIVLTPAAWQDRFATDPTGTVALAAAGLLWILLAVLAAGVLATLAALLPGTPGRLADVIARHVTPRSVRRIVHLLVGVSMAATMTATAIAPGAAMAATPRLAGGIPITAPAQISFASPLPPLGEPVGPVTESSATPPLPQLPTSTTTATTPHDVTVHPGDTLWELAARTLGRHTDPESIAKTWPRWWAANRAVIGANPDLLLPGEVLHPPAA
jgi:nucleoid-associated protein YgaU